MPGIDIVVNSEIENTVRVQQLSAMFDVPLKNKIDQKWQGDLPIEDTDWSIGLIVGPSGCGKSIIATELFDEYLNKTYKWESKSVIDDFAAHFIYCNTEIIPPTKSNVIYGAIIAIAKYEGVVTKCNSIWRASGYNWLKLSSVRKLNEPIFCTGSQMLWDVPENICTRLGSKI